MIGHIILYDQQGPALGLRKRHRVDRLLKIFIPSEELVIGILDGTPRPLPVLV
jgi:hypothetical protein